VLSPSFDRISRELPVDERLNLIKKTHLYSFTGTCISCELTRAYWAIPKISTTKFGVSPKFNRRRRGFARSCLMQSASRLTAAGAATILIEFGFRASLNLCKLGQFIRKTTWYTQNKRMAGIRGKLSTWNICHVVQTLRYAHLSFATTDFVTHILPSSTKSFTASVNLWIIFFVSLIWNHSATWNRFFLCVTFSPHVQRKRAIFILFSLWESCNLSCVYFLTALLD
jgi:hypothetical protein